MQLGVCVSKGCVCSLECVQPGVCMNHGWILSNNDCGYCVYIYTAFIGNLLRIYLFDYQSIPYLYT